MNNGYLLSHTLIRTNLVVGNVQCELLAVLQTRVETSGQGLARVVEVPLSD